MIVDELEGVEGILVALQEFDVLLQLRQHIGDTVSKAKVSSEPWFIFQLLIKRLEDELEQAPKDIKIPTALLGLENPPIAENNAAIKRSHQILDNLGLPSLVPNAEQEAALGRSVGNYFHFIWGPPGTGKTASLAQVARTLVSMGERVLVLAHANAAVDVAMLRVADSFSGSKELANGQVLRVGVPQLPEVWARRDILPEAIIERSWPDLVHQKRDLESRREKLSDQLRKAETLEQRDEISRELKSVRGELTALIEAFRQALLKLLQDAKAVGVTLSRLAIDDMVWNWPADSILVDEASMAAFPAVLAAAFRARKRLLIFGDFRQLPPIFLGKTRAARLWLGRDCFQIAGVQERIDVGEPEPRVTLLETQYRMATPIADIVSQFAYNGRLRTGAGVMESVQKIAAYGPWPGESLVLIDTSRLEPACFREPKIGSYSRVNPMHASVIVALADRLVADGCTSSGMITPYRAQSRLLAAASRRLREAGVTMASTIHRFQGSERDAVFVDLVDAPLESSASQLTGRDPEKALRLLNVAISRPRGKLLVLADVDFIRSMHPRKSPARKILRLMEAKALVVRPDISDLCQEALPNNTVLVGNWDQAQGRIIQDLEKTHGQVILNLPQSIAPSSQLTAILKRLASIGCRLVLFAPGEIAEALEDSSADLRLMNRPGGFFALLDGRVAYVGGHSTLGGFARFEDTHVVEVLEGLFLGSLLSQPPPRAEFEAAMARVCGRCPDCGEGRHPKAASNGRWVLRCENLTHLAVPLDGTALAGIVNVMDIRCPECESSAVVRAKGKRIFLGCSNYMRGCRGRPASLENLFGEV